MKILAVNAGSSSLKFKMFEMPEEKVIISGIFERIGIDGSMYTIKLNGNSDKVETELKNHADAVKILIKELMDRKVIDSLSELDVVAHRIVHGGDKYPNSIILDEEAINVIDSLSDLAPLHNPANLTCVRAFMDEAKGVTQVGCFDTAFHQTIEEDRFLYAVPFDWYKNRMVRKYGFHGMSHKYITERMSEVLNKKDVNLIVCHLGQGGSLSAVKNGKCIDTTMGFTPNSGIVMGTRSGDIDFGIIKYIMKETGKSFEEIDNDLNKKSGLLGLSEISSDSRDIEEAINNGNKQALLAYSVFINSVVKYVSSFYVELGGKIDAICFTAGIGENSPYTRKMIVEKLACLGFKIDDKLNEEARRGVEGKISTEDSIPVYVVPTEEELMMARDASNLVK